MTDLADVKEPNDGSFDEVVDILHRVLSFFSDLELSLPYLTEFIGKYAVFLYMLVAILNRIKEHHWKLRKWTNSIPSTLVSNATPESVIWVKLYYSEEPLPEDLQGYPEMRTLISEEFTRVEPGELVKLLVSQHCLTVYATVFAKNTAATKARPIAILHPLNLWQSLMVTNKETISLMSDASPCSDYERLPSEAESSVVSRHYCSELRHNVWTRVWKAFWSFFDWCLWRFNTGLFSTRRTVVFRNNSDGYVWVHIGAPRFSPDGSIESAALSGMTRVAPLADIPFHLCYDDEDLPKMVIEIYKGKRLATLNFIETKKITDSVAVAVYNSEYLTFHEEPDKVKERMPRREVVAEELDDSSDDDLSTVDSEDDNSTSEVESLDQWNQEYYWHPLAQSHVANATGSSIWVSCLSDLEDVQKLNSYLEEFSNGDRNIVNQVGFTKIRSRKYLVFEPAIRNDRECRVYITVLLEEDDRNLRIISSNFTVWPNYSVIVSREKQILRTEMSYIWTDDSGYRHDEWNR